MENRNESRSRRGVGCAGFEVRGGNTRSEALIACLESSPLFVNVPGPALRDLLGAFRHETWQARSPAMTAAHTAERLYVISVGRLKVCRIHPDTGREVALMLLGPGDVLDVVSLLDGTPLPSSAEALDDLEVFSAPLARVRAWRDEHPEFDRALHSCVARQLRSLADLASEMALYETDTRLSRLLLRNVATETAKPSGPRIEDLSHETLASLIGSVRVVVNRHIQELKSDGVISARRGHLAVEDRESLVARSGLPGLGAPQLRFQTPLPEPS